MRIDTRRRIGTFLSNLFSRNAYCKRLFYELCRKGCSPSDLAGLLFAISVFAECESKGLLETGEPTKDEVKSLVTGLRELARLVDHMNWTPLNPRLALLGSQRDDGLAPLRQAMARLYDKLPNLMNVYALHLHRFQDYRQDEFKRLSKIHFETLRLLLYVEESTGSPRYEDISNLLTEGFLTCGGTEEKLPTFFTSDALAKLKLRTRRFGLNSRSRF